MTTEVVNLKTREEIPFTNAAWNEILNIALSEGWDPQGTVLYKDTNYFQIDETWDSDNYTSHNGQVIESKDADALGEALSLAIKKKEIIKKINAEYDPRILSIGRIEEFIDKFCAKKFTKLLIV